MSTIVHVQDKKYNPILTIDDRIFLGEGLFETLRIVGSKPQYPEYHWQRLKNAALFLNIPFDVPLKLWFDKLNDCISVKKLKEGGVKAILSGGSAPRGLVEQAKEPHLIFDAFEYSINTQALNLISAPWQRDAKNPIYQLKSVNYLEAILARRHAIAQGADDVLFFNFEHHATDTTIANLFIIKNNQLITPALYCGVLPGIIRQRLLALCKERDLNCTELELVKETIVQADAVFVCNALQGIRPIRTFDGNYFDVEHPIIKLLQEILARDKGH